VHYKYRIEINYEEKTMSKEKEQYFIQLGLRKNGRIVKNEQYDIDKLARKVFSEFVVPSPNWFDRTFKTKTYRLVMEGKAYVRGYALAVDEFKAGIIRLIDNDVKGKGSPKGRSKK
jgi:hypothetical protein